MNRLLVFALAGLGFLGLSSGSAEAAGWHRTYSRPVCQPVVNGAVPTPVVTAGPTVCPPTPCAPVVKYYGGYRRSYYNRFHYGPRVHHYRWCR